MYACIVGCGKLLVTDGIWKLNYPVCLYKVPVKIDGIKVNMPDCCPNEPLHGKPFCQFHVKKLQNLGIPDDLLGFVKHFKDLAISEKTSIVGRLLCSYVVYQYVNILAVYNHWTGLEYWTPSIKCSSVPSVF